MPPELLGLVLLVYLEFVDSFERRLVGGGDEGRVKARRGIRADGGQPSGRTCVMTYRPNNVKTLNKREYL